MKFLPLDPHEKPYNSFGATDNGAWILNKKKKRESFVEGVKDKLKNLSSR